MLFFLAGQQRELSIPVSCSWSYWRDKNCQLWPGTTAESDLYWQLVPDKDSPIFSLSIPQLPLLPQLKGLQLLQLPHCVSQSVTVCAAALHCRTASEPSFFKFLTRCLKTLCHILASRPSTAKRHPWTNKQPKPFSPISSNHSSQEMTHRVRDDTTVKCKEKAARGCVNTQDSSFLILSVQILAAFHRLQIANSGCWTT